MRINIGSFSYRKGLPQDATEHGGGFVFDCRSIQNPGREEAFKKLTGLHEPVRQYLDERPEAQEFYNDVFKIISDVIRRYKARGFDYLSIQFGCTGGQHRSVYFAEQIAKGLRASDSELDIQVSHRDKPE